MSLSSWDGFSVVDPLHRENFQHSAALRDLRMTSAQSPGLIGAYSLGLHWEFPSSDFSGLEESAGTRTPGSQTRVPQILGLVGDSDSSFYTKALSFQSSLTPPPPQEPWFALCPSPGHSFNQGCPKTTHAEAALSRHKLSIHMGTTAA